MFARTQQDISSFVMRQTTSASSASTSDSRLKDPASRLFSTLGIRDEQDIDGLVYRMVISSRDLLSIVSK